jgi:hypothetical protein
MVYPDKPKNEMAKNGNSLNSTVKRNSIDRRMVIKITNARFILTFKRATVI